MTELLPPYTVEEVAKIFSVKPYTVREWIKTGVLKANKPGKLWQIPESEVARFANLKYGDPSAH